MQRFDFDFGSGRPRPPQTPLRIVFVGDFHGAAPQPPLAQRRLIPVDIEDFDAVCGRLAPACEVDGQQLTFAELEDFHPDALCRRDPRLREWLALRRELQSGTGFAAAAEQLRTRLGAAGPGGAAASETTHQAGPAPAENEAATLDRLLGGARQAAPPAATGALDRLISQAVAGHIAPDRPPGQAEALSAADAVLSELLRAILHAPEFAGLEASWLGLHRFLTQVETSESLTVELLCLNEAELLAQAADASDLQQLFAPIAGGEDGATPISLIVGMYAFGTDLRGLEVLGQLAAGLGATLLADAAPALLGCAGLDALADPACWAEPDPAWIAMRQAGYAHKVGLAAPQVLLRLPYGALTEPVDDFDFEEWRGPDDVLPRGLAGPLVAEVFADAFVAAGWSLQPEAYRTRSELPAHVYQRDGEMQRTPAASVWLREPALAALQARGVIGLASHAQMPHVRVSALCSIAQAPTELSPGTG